MHRGVGAIISNENRQQYFLQQKDEKYPVEEWKHAFSFWGGAVEKGETNTEALFRELREEIQTSLSFDTQNVRLVETFLITNAVEPYEFALYEMVLSNSDFQLLTQAKILEGKGVVKPQKDLQNLFWIWGLEVVVEKYLSQIP